MTAGKTATHVLARSRWVATTAAAALVLGACAGGDASSDASDEVADDASSSATASSSSSSATAEATDEVELTPPGTQLSFGETATVDYQLRDQGTVLKLTVDNARRGSLKDFAGFKITKPYEKNANYYYVRATAKNVGEGRLGPLDIPVWGISGDNTLLPPVQFTSSFKKCPTEPLPKKFGPGKRHQTCLVFLSPNKGTLEGVSYRPEETFDPIEWRGQVTAPTTKPKKKDTKKKKGGGGGGGGGGRSN